MAIFDAPVLKRKMVNMTDSQRLKLNKTAALLSLVREKGVVIDGAMGTMLMEAGLENGIAPEVWVLEKPEEILKVHQAYADAGVNILITNSFGGNSIKLKKAWLDNRVDEINGQAARRARSVAKDKCLVAGNIGPCGELLQPMGLLTDEEVKDSFAHQARVLAQSGVDLFLVQTFFSLQEIMLAIDGIKSVSDLPIIASMTFQATPKGFATMMGDKVEPSMKALMNAGVSVAGTNCSLGSAAMVRLAREVRRSVSIPVMAEPNAGVPEVRQGKTIYNEDVQTFAENMCRIKALGVEVLGGCCGTTPDHIRQMVLALKK